MSSLWMYIPDFLAELVESASELSVVRLLVRSAFNTVSAGYTGVVGGVGGVGGGSVAVTSNEFSASVSASASVVEAVVVYNELVSIAF